MTRNRSLWLCFLFALIGSNKILNCASSHRLYSYNTGQQLWQQPNQRQSIVNYFSGVNACSARRARLPSECVPQYFAQCTAQAQQNVCEAYVNNNLTEAARLNAAPATYTSITWPSGASANLGNLLTTQQVIDAPTRFVYPANPNSFYTILLQDTGEPTVPAATRDIGTPAHMLIGNVPGYNLQAGEVIFYYFPPVTPFTSSAPIIYNFFVYQQPSRLVFDEPHIPRCSFTGRPFFCAECLQRKYNLDGPQYGNFGGLTMNWQENNIAAFGNALRPAALGAMQPQVFALYFDPTQKYTVILLDADSGAVAPNYYVNWLVVNAGFRTLVTQGNPVIEYQRPAPPYGRPHRFVGLLYSQPNGTTINAASFTRVQRCDTTSARSQFNLDDFVKNNRLTLLDGSFTLMQFDGTTPC